MQVFVLPTFAGHIVFGVASPILSEENSKVCIDIFSRTFCFGFYDFNIYFRNNVRKKKIEKPGNRPSTSPLDETYRKRTINCSNYLLLKDAALDPHHYWIWHHFYLEILIFGFFLFLLLNHDSVWLLRSGQEIWRICMSSWTLNFHGDIPKIHVDN